MGGIHRREIEVGHDTCLLGFSGRESVDSAVFDATKLVLGGVDEVQTVTLTGSPSGGDFTLTYRDQTTADIAYNASAATVQAELRALSRIGTNGVTVTGNAGGPWTVTFGGALTKKDVELLVGADALTGGTTPAVAVAETTKGSAVNAGLYVLESGTILTHGDTSDTVKPYTGDDNIDEVQTVTLNGSPGGGTFILEFDGEQTTAIDYDATAAEVQTALEALPNVGADDAVVTGSVSGPYTVTFGGDLGGQSVSLMEADGSALTGGTAPTATVAQTTQGGEDEEIVGIFDGRREFMDNTARSNKEIPVYNFSCVFDKDKVIDFDEHDGALRRWGHDNACVFKSQGDS